MSSLLDQVQKGISPQPRRILLYGVAGIGKSTFGAAAPDSIFIQIEDGLSDIDCNSFPKSESFDDVKQAIRTLFNEDHPYKTVVIDSVDYLETLIWQETCKRHTQESIEAFGYNKGYLAAVDIWREVLKGLNILRTVRGMNVILIGHSQVEKFRSPEDDAYDRYTPRLHKQASPVLIEWVDEVLFATYRVFTKTVDIGFNKTQAKGIGTGERVLRTTERPTYLAKNRLGLPDEMEFSFKEYAKYLPGSNRKEKTNPKKKTIN